LLGRGDDWHAQHVDHKLIGHQIAPHHIRLRSAADHSPLGDVLAEEVAAGDVRDPKVGSQANRLGPLPGTRSANEHQAHEPSRCTPQDTRLPETVAPLIRSRRYQPASASGLDIPPRNDSRIDRIEGGRHPCPAHRRVDVFRRARVNYSPADLL
jgi:hypothetical protein